MAEVRNWQPGWIDRARWSAQGMLAPLFGGDERAALAYVDDKVKPTLEYMPGVGDAMAAAEARDAFSQGDYLDGGLLAAGAAAGLVPGVGDAVQKGIKAAVKSRGDEVLGLLKAGRADQVTDDMLDMGNAADNANLNAYLFENYDLPMDEASRMGRAQEMGFDRTGFHGTSRDYAAVKDGRTFYTTQNPQYAEIYTNPSASSMGKSEGDYDNLQPNIMNVRTRGADVLDTTTPEGRRVFDEQFFMKYGNGTPLSNSGYPDWADAEDFAYLFEDNELPYKAVIADEGGVPMPDGSIQYRGVSTATFDPASIRSNFARFDPRLRHLRNLSAGMGGLGLLGAGAAGYGQDEVTY